LAFPREPISRILFPYTGIISCVVDLPNGGSIGTAMIGRDGQWGAGQALDGLLSLCTAIVTTPVTAATMDAGRFRQLANQLPSFRAICLQYDSFVDG
jgi:CRP-like cAMP-binding protein